MATCDLPVGIYNANVLRQQVHKMRTWSWTDEDIARSLNMSVAVIREVRSPLPSADRQRSVQHSQLTLAMEKVMDGVKEGNRDDILLMLKLQQRESNLLGLDAPKEVISHNFEGPARDLSGMTVDELKRLAMEHIEATTIDVTPTRADEPAEPDPALARFRSARGSD